MTIERLSIATGFPPETLKHFARTGFLPSLKAAPNTYDGLGLLSNLEEVLDCD
jgi:hypothetical protein